MPARSQQQWKWMFATDQPFARRWAHETPGGKGKRFAKLPKRVKRKTCMDCVLAGLKAVAEGPSAPAPKAAKPAAGGKGQSLGPGITRIRGNLCNVHGRYGPCDSALSKKPKGGKGRKPRKPAKPKQTPEQRAQARAAEQTTNRAAVDKALGLPEDTVGALDDLRAGKAVDDDGGLVKMGLAEQAADGSYRLNAAGRALDAARNAGDTGRARDIMSGAKDRATARTERQTAAEARHAAAEAKRTQREQERAARLAKRPTGGGGGGSKKAPPKRAPMRRSSGGGAKLPGGGGGGSSGGGVAKPTAPKFAADEVEAAQAFAAGKPANTGLLVKRGLARIGARGRIFLTAAGARAVREQADRTKSFAVFKDAAGQWRWLARTTTAYEDRDSEVISTKALDDSAASPAPRGPLRWWHMGRPDPTSAQPWGAGVDLGWCDFAAVSGRTLIESGTFKSEPIARAVAVHQGDLELSPGFFHAAGEPDSSGVFHHIRIFERSLVPKWAGRASNPYTGLIVEKTMDQKKIQALKELGASDEVITALLADVQQTEKSAEADGVRYKDARPVVDWFVRMLKNEPEAVTKEAEAPPAEEPAPPPDPLAELMATVKALQEEVAALKAPPVVEEKQGMGDMMPDAETPDETMAEGGMEEPADEGGLTLSADDLSAIGQVIAATLEPLIASLGITQKLEGHLGELKTMMGGFAKTKDDERAQLTARLDQTEAKVAELAGDLPRAGYRASQSPENTMQALASAVALKDGGVPTDDNPFADLVQQLFPNQR